MVRAVLRGIAVVYALARRHHLGIIAWVRRLLTLFAELLDIWLIKTS